MKNLHKEFEQRTQSALCSIGHKQEKVAKYKTVVRNMSFAVSPGEVFGLLGHNGAGKTTTLNCITAEHGITAGQVLTSQALYLVLLLNYSTIIIVP